MGKGDKKTKKGKIFKGTFGKTRPSRTPLVIETKKKSKKSKAKKFNKLKLPNFNKAIDDRFPKNKNLHQLL